MVPLAAEAQVPVILMHMQGTPAVMQDRPTYKRLIPEILTFLREAMDQAIQGGIRRDMIILDPGIGFGKSYDHNLQVIRGLDQFRSLGRPIIIGSSRKAFIGQILGKEPDGRDVGTMATVTASVLAGAHIVRVHNVAMATDTVRVVDAIRRGRVQ
jgi:dihydropteroate synthase